MLKDLELVVKVQGIDVRSAGYRKEIAALPKQIAVIEKALESHQRKLDADRAALAGGQKERRQIDLDIQTFQQKIAKLRDQMNGAKTNEQFRAFQNEIAFAEGEIKKREDRILELMEHSESLEQNVKAAEEALKRERQQVEAQKSDARNRTAEDQQRLNELMSERKELVSQIQPGIIGVYDRLARKYPEPLAEAVSGRCAACKLEIRPQLFQDLRTTDKLITCENCGRILYYNPPVAFDSDSGAPVKFSGGTRVDMS